MANMYRDVNLSEVNESYIGKELKVAGWVENIRDHGGVSFIDLRDMYGVLQVVLRDTTLLDGIHKEECIAIEGIMEQRDEETYNPKIPSGTIELEAKKITILGQVYQQLPFEVQTSKEVREDVRLKYRYLDLRNQKVKDNMIFRSKVIAFLRQKMTDMGFLEIQTPILCASSPEGARDYIVPSRKYKGKFYALPQAPQQYKQLLMVSGFDKYFQIAPCFRDEDARADRSPGEFYQLDFEMSFATQEDVFRIGEEVLTETFAKFAPEGYEVTQAPYPIISYKQAMLEFGSDKPDLRNPLRIIDLSEFFNKCTFKPFQNKTVRAINVHAKLSKGQHEKLLKFATGIGMGGLGYLEVLEDGSYKGPIDKFIPEELKGEIKDLAGLQPGDTIFFIADKEDRAAYFAGQIRNELGERLDLIEKNAYRFCYVNDFPMFERDPETKKIGFTHNPFSMPQGGLEALNTKDPLDILAYQYDIVCNGVELSSGAVRNHDMQIMVKAFEIAGYDEEVLKTNKENGYLSFENPGSGTTKNSYWNATVTVRGTGFEADGIIFENSANQYISTKEANDVVQEWTVGGKGTRPTTAGDTSVQNKSFVERAAAIAILGDKAYFNNCKFVGRQDTLYGASNIRAAFNKCTAMGGTDFIFGGMVATFYKSDIMMNTSEDNNDVSYLTA